VKKSQNNTVLDLISLGANKRKDDITYDYVRGLIASTHQAKTNKEYEPK
jgi:hypothetical protein